MTLRSAADKDPEDETGDPEPFKSETGAADGFGRSEEEEEEEEDDDDDDDDDEITSEDDSGNTAAVLIWLSSVIRGELSSEPSRVITVLESTISTPEEDEERDSTEAEEDLSASMRPRSLY
jgi:hypothetical protein